VPGNSEQGVAELQDAKRHLLDRLREEVGDLAVVQAMSAVPREAFVPEPYAHMAYDDIPLPIGEDQTVSQPYMVALMLRAIEPRRSDKVLEIGTGSGYQAAVLSHLVERVVSVERIRALADAARRRLARMEYANVDVIDAGPQLGWPEEAPYDAIIVAAGAPKLPRGLIGQLTTGGRLVIPVGSRDSQELMKVTRTGEDYSVRTMASCRFVPLIGEGAWPDEQ